jgi:quinoprotein glucose dehydrogenase
MGLDVFTRTVRNGRGAMPAFSTEVLSAETLKGIAAYLDDPGKGEIPPPSSPEPAREPSGRPDRPTGLRQFAGPFGAQWLSRDGLPVIGPPWSELVAYDLNEGVIKWRTPIGSVPSLAAKGITNTGSYRPRNGPVVTAGGLIFQASGGDQTVRAYNKENGKLLWEKHLEGNPDGIPAVYEVGGRQYVVFSVRGDTGGGSRTPAMFIAGKPEAQGYYAFALSLGH